MSHPTELDISGGPTGKGLLMQYSCIKEILLIRYVAMIKQKATISTPVIQELQNSESPLSVEQVMSHLEKVGFKPNKTTIYRILEKLSQKKVVPEIKVRNGSSYYEFSSGNYQFSNLFQQCKESN